MLSELSQKAILFSLLHRIDVDLANQCRQNGCAFCDGGPLHQANYLRKPRGGPSCLPEEYSIRHSLCCGREGCRRRTLPPSCLFLGRKVYWAMVILIVMVLRQARPNGASTRELMRTFGIDRKTLFRWIAYFRDVFPHSAKWQILRGRISSQVKDSRLPADLADHFFQHSGCKADGLFACLRFLGGG